MTTANLIKHLIPPESPDRLVRRAWDGKYEDPAAVHGLRDRARGCGAAEPV